MSSSAFVATTPATFSSSFTPTSLTCFRKNVNVSCRRVRSNVHMMAEQQQQQQEQQEQSTTETSKQEEQSEGGFQAPSLNTTAFSDFVESLQSKAGELQERVENVDTDKLLADSIDSSKGLADNFLAGDWLNRGELYGGIQILLVFLLFRQLPSIDALVALLSGPMLIIAGAGVSGKALWDLGVKNLSIWPAPVPNGSLKTEGAYQYVRHPIYSGLLIASIGYAITSGSPAKLAVAAAMAVLIAKKVDVEEDFLCEAYDDYEEYKDKVPFKIIPKVY